MNRFGSILSIFILSICIVLFLCPILLNKLVFTDDLANKDSAEIIQKNDGLKENKNNENAEIIIKDLILKEIEKHKGLQVIINAQEGKIIHSDDKIECKYIKCCLCDKNKQIADLMASNAQIDKNTKNVFLTGDAIIHFDDITISSKEVSYNYSNQKLSTERQTKYIHPNFSLLAQQSKINLKKNQIKMSGGVQSEFLNCSTKD